MAHGGQVWQAGDPSYWLDFSANLRPEGPPDWVLTALNEAISDACYYPDVAMALEKRALGRCLNLPDDCVLPTAGGMAAIELAVGALEGKVCVEAPSFLEYESAARRRGNGGSGIVRVLCNPNNPTGRTRSRAEVLSILAETEAGGGNMIVDEAFVFCCPEHSVVDMVSAHPALIVVESLTKSLCIPGVRLGYLCAHPDVIKKMIAKQPPWTLNCFASHVLRALPDNTDALEKDAQLNCTRRAHFAQTLKAMGFEVYPSEANFLLVNINKPAHPIAEALKQHGILVRECMDFPGIDDDRHLRLAVKTDEQNTRLITTLRTLL